jgi:monoamine oxidase
LLTDFSIQAQAFSSAIQKFINLDGHNGQFLMPFPHNPGFHPEAAQLDQVSVKDRLDQIQPDLSTTESILLESYLGVLSGAKPEDAGLFDVLRVWALCGYSADGLAAMCSLFKLRDGQSFLARKFYDEALGTGNLAYKFDCPVVSISDHTKYGVDVKTATRQVFRGRKVICTIPQNVLDTIAISPPLTGLQQEVVRTHHVNQTTKVHAEVLPAELRTWIGISPDNKLIQAAGEAFTPAGNARIVCFGTAANPIHPEASIQDTVDAVKAFDEKIEVKRLVFHNWVSDPYSKGAWSTLPPGMSTTRNIGVLREAHGNVHFANSDWALGWRAFIDGAIEEGTRAAKLVTDQLRDTAANKL